MVKSNVAIVGPRVRFSDGAVRRPRLVLWAVCRGGTWWGALVLLSPTEVQQTDTISTMKTIINTAKIRTTSTAADPRTTTTTTTTANTVATITTVTATTIISIPRITNAHQTINTNSETKNSIRNISTSTSTVNTEKTSPPPPN